MSKNVVFDIATIRSARSDAGMQLKKMNLCNCELVTLVCSSVHHRDGVAKSGTGYIRERLHRQMEMS